LIEPALHKIDAWEVDRSCDITLPISRAFGFQAKAEKANTKH